MHPRPYTLVCFICYGGGLFEFIPSWHVLMLPTFPPFVVLLLHCVPHFPQPPSAQTFLAYMLNQARQAASSLPWLHPVPLLLRQWQVGLPGIRQVQVLLPHVHGGPRQVWVMPLCDIPSGCCFFTGLGLITCSSLCMLHQVAAPSSVGRCGLCSCWCRFCVGGAQYLAYRGCADCCSSLADRMPAETQQGR